MRLGQPRLALSHFTEIELAFCLYCNQNMRRSVAAFW